MGALVGRLIGEMIQAHLEDYTNVVPSTFALVGAAGLSCGATQTISAAVVSRIGDVDVGVGIESDAVEVS